MARNLAAGVYSSESKMVAVETAQGVSLPLGSHFSNAPMTEFVHVNYRENSNLISCMECPPMDLKKTIKYLYKINANSMLEKGVAAILT